MKIQGPQWVPNSAAAREPEAELPLEHSSCFCTLLHVGARILTAHLLHHVQQMCRASLLRIRPELVQSCEIALALTSSSRLSQARHLANTSVETNGTGAQAAKTPDIHLDYRTDSELEVPGTNGANTSRCPMSWRTHCSSRFTRNMLFTRLIRANHQSVGRAERQTVFSTLTYKVQLLKHLRRDNY
ncbi:hypothetical protein Trisim1_011391 [Trichoderma cf. simile WF8]